MFVHPLLLAKIECHLKRTNTYVNVLVVLKKQPPHSALCVILNQLVYTWVVSDIVFVIWSWVSVFNWNMTMCPKTQYFLSNNVFNACLFYLSCMQLYLYVFKRYHISLFVYTAIFTYTFHKYRKIIHVPALENSHISP